MNDTTEVVLKYMNCNHSVVFFAGQDLTELITVPEPVNPPSGKFYAIEKKPMD